MGHFLFWLEAAIASILFTTLGMAFAAKIRHWWRRWIFIFLWEGLVALPWLLIIGLFWYVEYPLRNLAAAPLKASWIAGTVAAAASLQVMMIGLRRSRSGDGPVAARWKPGWLAVALLAMILITCSTLWTLDQQVQQEMIALDNEASMVGLSITPARLLDRDNAAVPLWQAFEVLNRLNQKDHRWYSQVSLWLNPQDGDYDPDNAQMLAFLQKAQPSIGLIRQAAERPGLDWKIQYTPPSLNIAPPMNTEMRGAISLLCLNSRVAARQGPLIDAMKDLQSASALSKLMTTDPTINGCMTAIGGVHESFESFQFLLDQGPVSAEVLGVPMPADAAFYRQSMYRTIPLETAVGLSIFAMEHPERILSRQLGSRDMIMVYGQGIYHVFLWRDDVKSYRRTMNQIQWAFYRPYYQVADQWPIKISPVFPDGQPVGLYTFNWVPTMSGITKRTAEADTQSSLIYTAMSMCKYKQATGSYPDTLEQLVPQHAMMIPIDPFSGNSLKMGEKDGWRIIYSLGPDMSDDAGTPYDYKTHKGDIILTLPK